LTDACGSSHANLAPTGLAEGTVRHLDMEVDQAIESYLTLDIISPSSDKVGAADHRDMARVD
jgi:hypothetical protein